MDTKKKINNFVFGRINSLTNSLDSNRTKAQLAQLRRGIGKQPGEIPELWGMFLQDLPEELMSKRGKPTYAEWAIYTTLTLFALHQQGHRNTSMYASGEENRLGRAVRKLINNEDDEERIRLKLSLVSDSSDMEELSYRLRTIIRLLSASNIELDYTDLAVDLFQFQFEDSADKVRLKWGEDFYRYIKTDEDRKEDINEN